MFNSRYKEQSYWDERYDETDETHTEWLCGYDDVKRKIETICQEKCQEVLMLGTGDSKFPSDMYRNGYKNITNVDYSNVIIEKMMKKYSYMKWIWGDIRNLNEIFASASYDIVIEKATIDSLLVDETDFWHPSDETKTTIDVVLTQIYEILNEKGIFISITFAQPHFRLPFLLMDKFRWSVNVDKFGDNFHYFIYTMIKNQTKNVDELDRYLYPVKHLQNDYLSKKQIFLCDDTDADTFLNSILL